MAKMNDIVKKINDKFKKPVANKGVDYGKVKKISTGIFMLDYLLGGGIPIGKMAEFYGEEGSGKTTTALKVVSEAQNLCANCFRPVEDIEVQEIESKDGEIEYNVVGQCDCYSKGLCKVQKRSNETKEEFKDRLTRYKVNSFEPFIVVWLDAERSFNSEWAQKIGVDLRRLIVIDNASSAEEYIDIYASLVHDGLVDMVVLDSIASLTPSVEMEESAEKWQQGLQARLVNKMFRRVNMNSAYAYQMYGKLVTHLLINQVREKIGVMFGDKTTRPAGKGQDYFSSVMVKFWKSKVEKSSEDQWGLTKQAAISIANSVRIGFRVEKNRFFPPKGESSFVMNTKTAEVANAQTIMQIIEGLGYLMKDKGGWNVLNDDGEVISSFKKKSDIVKFLKSKASYEYRQWLLEKMFELR